MFETRFLLLVLFKSLAAGYWPRTIGEYDLLCVLSYRPLVFFDLFTALRSAGLQLTMEHYGLLQAALWHGHGLHSWDDLQQTCEILWVKPSSNYDRELFRQEFNKYQQQFLATPLDLPVREMEPLEPSGTQPIMPIRKLNLAPTEQPKAPARGSIGVQTAPSYKLVNTGRFPLHPQNWPISVGTVRDSWRSLQQTKQRMADVEIDLEGTVASIMQLGFFDDVVLKSVRQPGAELILLVDESAATSPYLPAIEPLIKAIGGGWVRPSKIYRFTGYPHRRLADWQLPRNSTSIDTVLRGLHSLHSIVMVVSDAGAAIGIQNEDLVAGVAKFWQRWEPCVAELVWINPLPASLWLHTPATEINDLLGGRMLALDDLGGREIRRLLQGLQNQVDRWGQS
jgi:uncharacterized protein